MANMKLTIDYHMSTDLNNWLTFKSLHVQKAFYLQEEVMVLILRNQRTNQLTLTSHQLLSVSVSARTIFRNFAVAPVMDQCVMSVIGVDPKPPGMGTKLEEGDVEGVSESAAEITSPRGRWFDFHSPPTFL